MKTIWPVFLAAALLLIGCGHAPAPTPAPLDPLKVDLDTAVNPGVDFFTYANGGWLAKNPIPKTESSWGVGNEVEDQINARLRTLSEQDAAAKAAPGSDAQKVGDF
ncbi:MAG: hypothetical protein ACRD1A_03700, partial [Terriglobales bacterium]